MAEAKFNSDNVRLLRPGMEPCSDPPLDFSRMTANAFLAFIETTGAKYEWISAPDGADTIAAGGVFTTVGRGSKNRVYTRVRLLDDDGDELAHIDLSAAACVSLAHALLIYAVASSNVNQEPQAISTKLVGLFEEFMHPSMFRQFVNAYTLAAEEQIKAKLLVRNALAEHGSD